jgi:hypothetical protein
MKRSKLVVALATLGLGGLACSLASLAFHGEQKAMFALLFFVIPILWLLWIICAFVTRRTRAVSTLVALWLLVDMLPLSLFVSFALEVTNWANSTGVDLAALLTYFPIIVPTIFILDLLPPEALHVEGLGGGWDGVALWAVLSAVGAVQSAAIVAVFRAIGRSKNIAPHGLPSTNV